MGKWLRLGVAGAAWAVVVVMLLNVAAGAALRAQHGRLPEGVGRAVRSHVDPALSAAVTVLARKRAEVRCWSPRDWKRRTAGSSSPVLRKLGAWRAYTDTDLQTVHVSPEVCAELSKLAAGAPIGRGREADAAAWSLAALSHEAQHVRGLLDEAATDCYGMQLMDGAAVTLGRTYEEGDALAKRYRRRWQRWLEPPYRSDECRDGGALDLNPTDPGWP